MVADRVTVNRPTTIADLAARHRLPAIYSLRGFVQAGGLTIPQEVLMQATEVIQ